MKRVMFLGAGAQHASTITQVQQAGYEVVAIEQDPSAAARFEADEFFPVDINDQQTALEIANISGVDAVLALSPAGIATASYITNEISLVGLSTEATFACRDIAGKRTAWENANIPYLACADLDDWHGKMSRGQSFMVESLIQDGEIRFQSLSEVSLKLIDDHYINASQFYSNQFDADLTHKIHERVHQSLLCLGVKNAVAYTQLLLVDDELYLINQYPCAPVGPIMSAVLPTVYGFNFVQSLCAVLIGEPVQLDPQPPKPCGLYYIDLEPGKLKSLSGQENAKANDAVLDLQITVMPGEDIIVPSRSSQRAGYAIIKGDTAEQTQAAYQHVINEIQYELQT